MITSKPMTLGQVIGWAFIRAVLLFHWWMQGIALRWLCR